MTKRELKAIRAVVDYLYADEEGHFLESVGDERATHIFNDVRILQEYCERMARKGR